MTIQWAKLNMFKCVIALKTSHAERKFDSRFAVRGGFSQPSTPTRFGAITPTSIVPRQSKDRAGELFARQSRDSSQTRAGACPQPVKCDHGTGVGRKQAEASTGRVGPAGGACHPPPLIRIWTASCRGIGKVGTGIVWDRKLVNVDAIPSSGEAISYVSLKRGTCVRSSLSG